MSELGDIMLQVQPVVNLFYHEVQSFTVLFEVIIQKDPAHKGFVL